mmetsp:Transcript_22544/g.55808  ORF Transcript_22544/g.55808 Transcript_22544/m.55808 type:complete len:96 (+) Transcript_22544:1611-1898(+)
MKRTKGRYVVVFLHFFGRLMAAPRVLFPSLSHAALVAAQVALVAVRTVVALVTVTVVVAAGTPFTFGAHGGTPRNLPLPRCSDIAWFSASRGACP